MRLCLKIETFQSHLSLSTTSTQGNYGEFIPSKRKTILHESFEMQEIMRKENGKRGHKSKDIVGL